MSAFRKSPVLLLAAISAFSCTPRAVSPPSAEAPAIEAAVAVARRQSVVDEIETTATLAALRQAEPGTRVLGRIESIHAREGDRVAAGALLARIERGALTAAAEQAAAGVAMARTRLDNAAAMARRMTDLHGRGSATAKNLEDAAAAQDIAEAGLAQAQADLEASRAAVAYAEVRSPMAGWIVRRLGEAGDMTAPGQPLFVIEDLSELEARASVSESAIAALGPEAPAVVEVDAVGGVFAARLYRLIPSGDPVSRTFEARFRLPNPDGRLKSGLFARVRLPRGDAREALLVPARALLRRGQLEGLFVLAEDRAHLRFVRTGRIRENGWVEVRSGLEDGETYLVAPPDDLEDGRRVRGAVR